MRISSLSPSFKSVIPVKRIVVGDDNSINSQLRLGTDGSDAFSEIPVSCSDEATDKILKSLCRILAKNDGKNPLPQTTALNNMLRRSFAYVDKSYKLPAQAMTSDQTTKPKECDNNGIHYILTGREASEYAVNGKNIGGAVVLTRDYNASSNCISEAKKRFGIYKEKLINDKNRRLQTNTGMHIGMVIYVDRVKAPQKAGSNSLEIKAVDFEYM